MMLFSRIAALLVLVLCISSATARLNVTFDAALTGWDNSFGCASNGPMVGTPAVVFFNGIVHMVHRAPSFSSSPLYYSQSSPKDGTQFTTVTLANLLVTSDPTLIVFQNQLVLIYVNNGVSTYATYDGKSANPFSKGLGFQPQGVVGGAVSAVVVDNKYIVASYANPKGQGMITTCDSSFKWATAYANGQSWSVLEQSTMFAAPDANGNTVVYHINNGDQGNQGLLFWAYTSNPLIPSQWLTPTLRWKAQTTTHSTASVLPILNATIGSSSTNLYAYFYVRYDGNALVHTIFDSLAVGDARWRTQTLPIAASTAQYQVSSPSALYFHPENKIYLYYANLRDNTVAGISVLFN